MDQINLFIPPHVTQRDPKDPLEFSHCWAAIGAWCASGATGGVVSLTAEEFARRAGGGSGRKPGSGTEQDIVHGLRVLGIDSEIVETPYGQLQDRVATPRRALFAIAVDYDQWPPELDCMAGTAGPDVDHMVGMVPGMASGKVQTENPLCTKYQEVPVGTIERAAAKYSRANGRAALHLVRVVRPVPAQLDDLRKELLTLTEQRDGWRDVAVSIRSKAMDILDIELPVPAK